MLRLISCGSTLAFGAIVSAGVPVVASHDLPGLVIYPVVNSTRAASGGGTWCNLGDEPAPWSATTASHPVTAENLLRVENGALRHIGLSWAWHHITCPLQMTACGTCTPEPGGCPASLGVGCSTTSNATILGMQSALGMRSLINASTGVVPFPLVGPPITDGFSRRCKYAIAEVDPAQHPTARFALQAVTVAAPSGDPLERTITREVVGMILMNGGASYAAASVPTASAVDFWKAVEPSVTIASISIPGDGDVRVATRVAPEPTGGYRYDYAIENLNSFESVGAFTVPIASGTPVTSVVFAAPLVHSGEVTSNVTWNQSLGENDFTFFTVPFADNENANAIRWGTTYSFGFVTDRAPANRTATLTLFRSGAAAEVTIPAPSSPADINGDGNVDSADLSILLGAWGRCRGCASDLNGDGVVGSADLGILLGAWN